MNYEFADTVSLAAYLVVVALILLICFVKARGALNLSRRYGEAARQTHIFALHEQFKVLRNSHKFRFKFWTIFGFVVIVANVVIIIYWGI